MFKKVFLNGINIISVSDKRANSQIADKFQQYFDETKLQGKKILLDLSGCEYIDSTFLGMLVRNFLKMKKENYTVKITAGPKVIFILDNVSHLSTIIDLYQDLDEAVKSFE